jgi:nucleotide-binding universal stress UspA family protein
MTIMLTDYSRIVVAYDHSDLSKKALKMAMNLAKQDPIIQLNVVTALYPDNPAPYSYGIPAGSYYEDRSEEIKMIREEIEGELALLPNKTSVFVIKGNPGPTITDFIKQNDADLVVMGSRGLSGLKELFLGSVSHYVAQKATCPVLIVK